MTLTTRTAKPAGACSITWAAGGYVVRFPYDPAFIERFKTLPYSQRAYSKPQRAWIVAPEAIAAARDLLSSHFDQQIEIPPAEGQPEEVTGEICLQYLGAAKDRGAGVTSALGYANGSWSIEIPQTVLENWFEGQTSEDKSTLFAVLLVPETATAEEIKKAHKRLVRQWHPDVCREDNAADRFREIQQAYEFLSDEQKRLRYLAGLHFERLDAPASRPHYSKRFNTYAPPLRCGLLNVTGVMKLGRLVVSQINSWVDITDSQGRVMVSSWQVGAETFSIQWREA